MENSREFSLKNIIGKCKGNCKMAEENYHIPALLTPTLDLLEIKPEGVYVDATFGGGGHSRAILDRLGPDGRLFGFDRDIDALRNAPDDPRFTFVHSDYRFIPNFLHFHGVDKVDGLLADLGVSFHHFDDASRGFSFREDAPLDMRMNRSGERTAADILRDTTPEQLEQMLRSYTDLKRSGVLASAIVRNREHSPIDTTARLTEVLTPLLNPRNLKKDLAQAFQALRIQTNDEMQSLRVLLDNSLRVLKPGGRLAVITYHSIEDRLVKNFMRAGNTEGHVRQDLYGRVMTPWKPVTKSPITPDAEEVERNPRSRSAKLRVAELTDHC